MRLIGFLFILFVFEGCSQKPSELFSQGRDMGLIEKRLGEASGLVASIRNPGYLWTINDSGNPPEVFLIDGKAEIRQVCKLVGITNRDWEDIAIGAGPLPGKNYLYVGDIGDNQARYDLKFIYRFQEPLMSSAKSISITQFDTLILRMPDGRRDAEAMMIDPQTHDLFIISKREKSVGLYQAHYPFGKDTIVLDKVAQLPFSLIVSGSISASGMEIIIKDYSRIYYWKRSVGEDVPHSLTRKPIELLYEPEPQGEGIAWANNSTGFYTISESPGGKQTSLKFYRRK